MPIMPKRTLMLGLLLASVALAPRVRADTSPEDRAAADALYAEAGKLGLAKHWAEACPKLEASLKLDPAIGTLLRLGSCYEALGRTASAWSVYNDAVALAAKSDDKRGKQAELDAKRLEPTLARMLLDVAPENRVAGVEVRRDGTLLNAGAWGSAVPIDPGEHTIEATGPGKLPWKTTITIEPKPGVTTVPVPVLQNAPSTPEEPTARGSAWSTQRTIGVVVGSVGVTGVVVGSVLGVLAMSKKASADAQCSGPMQNQCDPAGFSLRYDEKHLGNASTAAFVAGGVVAASGLVVFLASPQRPQKDAVQVGIAPRLAGVAVEGSW
jgi:hypothetical protein